jgi:hypothetical protein
MYWVILYLGNDGKMHNTGTEYPTEKTAKADCADLNQLNQTDNFRVVRKYHR